MLLIPIAFISLIGLLILHELSHFLLAKKFGVEVEEFGIGLPPRLFGKKIGGTLYSLNLLPFGAFVKVPEKKMREKPGWQRALILIAGVLSFWIMAAILLSIVFWIGAPFQISDKENENLINPRVQIVNISPNSPADVAGLKVGDIIKKVKSQKSNVKSVNKIKEVQEFTHLHKGEKITLIIQRGKKEFDVELVPRVTPPQEEGPMGVGLVRVATKKYPLGMAIWQSILTTFQLTWQIITGYAQLAKRAVLKKPLEAELIGPVGVLNIFVQAEILGFVYFLQTIALISLQVAVFNALPVPITDGGRLLFLGIEKIRKKPLNEKIEQRINAAFFVLLLVLMIWVTMKDIKKLF